MAIPSTFEVAATASFSQAQQAIFGDWANMQCSCNSHLAVIRAVSDSTPLTSVDLENILLAGHDYYLAQRHKHNLASNVFYLAADEHLESDVLFAGQTFSAPIAMVFYGYHCQISADEFRSGQSHQREMRVLRDAITSCIEADSVGTGYIFYQRTKIISFWAASDCFYVFDPHSVDRFRCYDEETGTATLFRCSDVDSLALLLHGEFDDVAALTSRWALYRVQVTGPERQAFPVRRGTLSQLQQQGTGDHRHDSDGSEGFSDEEAWTRPAPERPDLSGQAGESARPSIPLPGAGNGAPEESSQTSGDETMPPPSAVVTASSSNSRGRGRGRGRPRGRRGGRGRRSQVTVPPPLSDTPISVDSEEDEPPAPPHSQDEGVNTTNAHSTTASTRGGGRPKKRKRTGGRRALEEDERARRRAETHARQRAQRDLEAERDRSAERYERSPERHQQASRQSEAIAVERSPERIHGAHASRQGRYQATHRETISDRRRRARAVPPAMRAMTCIGDTPLHALGDVEPHALEEANLSRCPVCSGCGRSRLFNEEATATQFCCGSGTQIPPLLPPLTATFYDSEQFLSKARLYNSLFSFAALNCKGNVATWHDERAFYAVHGRVYSQVFAMTDEHSKNNLTMYIHDTAMQAGRAVAADLNIEVLAEVREYLDEVNPFLPQLRRLSTVSSDTAFIHFQRTSRATHGPVLGDAPIMCDEIAAIIELCAEREARSVVIWKVGQERPQFLNHLDPAYEALQFPLLFPHGSAGWDHTMRGSTGKKISLMRYARHLLLAEPRFSSLRRLSQEWLVDIYCQVEEHRLLWLRLNQGDMRSAERADLAAVADAQDARQVGADIHDCETIAGEVLQAGRVYLSSNFTHSPRYMKIKYQDCMSLVAHFGKPTFFLTITCSPQWPEIQVNLRPGERATDRPDLCVRVFKLKLHYVTKLIKAGALFGPIDYYSSVIEYQKRYNVHAHLAIRVRGGGPVLPEDIDRFICATIPPVGTPHGLREQVLKYQVHGPCGRANPRCPCMKDGKCTKYFPKPASNVTFTDSRGYVNYRRPCTETVQVRGQPATDANIVSFNPPLCVIVPCHHCCEIANDSLCIKYLMKYITKGPDHALAAVTENAAVDEIENYVTTRYMGAPEAAWKLFKFANVQISPKVDALTVHLPQRDRIVHRRGDEAAAVVAAPSDLLLYFARPAELADLTYVNLFQRFNRSLEPRKRLRSFGPILDRYYLTERSTVRVMRMHWISPAAGEPYYLRMLLSLYPAFSFEELRTVDGELLPKFQAACEALNLLSHEGEWPAAMREAATFKTARLLRSLFVCMVICGAPGGVLWAEFAGQLGEDHLFHHIDNPAHARNLTLLSLSRSLARHGRTLANCGIDEEPVEDSTEAARERLLWDDNALAEYHAEWLPLLDGEQRAAYDQLDDALQHPAERSSRVFFVDGPAGTGKSICLKTLTAKWRLEGKVVKTVASTGLAALNYEHGETAHALFRIPVDKDSPSLVCQIDVNSERAALLRQTDAFIWDEASMANARDVSAVNRLLQDLTFNSENFGGKLFIFAGDYRQICPVLPGAGLGDIIRAGMRNLGFWADVKNIYLTRSRRALDPQFADFLLTVGDGRAEAEQLENDRVRVIALPHVPFTTTMEHLISFVYPPDVLGQPDVCAKRAILSGTNANAAQINASILEQLPGEATLLPSADSVKEMEAEFGADPGFLAQFGGPGVPDSQLTLKEGAVVMLLKNLCFQDGLVNGARLIVIKISPLLIECRKPGTEELVLISRIPITFQVGRGGMEVIRRQFPLRLAYAITVNKSQGQTLERAGVDLRADVFQHGQLYVALGRVRTRDSLMVLVREHRVDAETNTAYAYNLVYSELL